MRLFPLVVLAVLLLIGALPAVAQTTSGNFNVTTSQLDPGGDWAAQIIQNVFPVSGSGGVSTMQTTVIGQMVGLFSGFVGAIAMAMVCYSVIMKLYRGAETAKVSTHVMSTMAAVRLGFAAVMMYPVPTLGFSVGQAAVVKVALMGVGMAKTIYNEAVQAIGPDAMVVATPIVPGTETIVLGLIKNELCRSLINEAANATDPSNELVPEPVAMQVGASTAPMTVLAYNLSPGNVGSTPACGEVMIPAPLQTSTNLAGVSIDQSSIQRQALTTVLQNDIAQPVQSIAASLYYSHSMSALTQLQSVLVNATRDYQQQLTTAATNITQQLRSALQNSNASALANSSSNQNQLIALGWTGAGAYYLEFARLNGDTLSLLSATPQIIPPTYQGLGPSLSSDIAPFVQASQATLTTLSDYVTTQDGLSAPGGSGEIFSGATPDEDGSSLIGQIFRRLHLSDYLLQAVQSLIAPSSTSWTDPFSGLMSLGNTLITISISAMGAAAIAASSTGSAATSAFQMLTGNFVGAGMTLVAHSVMNFLATPIFLLLLGLLIPGLMIAFVLPMIPWVMWIAGVMGWLILVCEAVIAVPLWMLAHITMGGDSLHGNAKEGYALIFNVMFRPTLMIFGLFLGYFVFASMSWLIRQTFGVAAGFVLDHGWIVTNILGLIVLLSIFVMTHVVAALMSFRLISLLPHHIPRLVGFHGAGRVDMDEFSKQAATVGVAGTLATVDKGLREGMKASTEQMRLGSPEAVNRSSQTGGVKQSAAAGADTTLNSVTEVSAPDDGF